MAILNKTAQDVLDDIQADIVEAAKGYLSNVMGYLEEARNVLDTDVKDRIKHLVLHYTDNATVLTWFTSQYHKWLINDGPATRITELSNNAPDWAKAALAKDGEIYKVNWTDVETSLPTLIDYIRYEVGQSNNISRLSVLDAMVKQKAWHEELKSASAVFSMEDGIAEELKCSNGLTWYSLTGRSSLNREGELMGHCVGSYYDGVRANRKQIFTLRDAKNIPHVTIEASKSKIQQIKGKANQEVVEKYKPAILDFFAYKEWDEIRLDLCDIPKLDTIEFLKSKNMFKVLGKETKKAPKLLGIVATSQGDITLTLHDIRNLKSKPLTKPVIIGRDEFTSTQEYSSSELRLTCNGHTYTDPFSAFGRMNMSLDAIERYLKLRFEASDLKAISTILRLTRDADVCRDLKLYGVRQELFSALCDEGSDVVYTKPNYATVRRILKDDLLDILTTYLDTCIPVFRASPEYVVFDFGSPVIRMYRDTSNKMWNNPRAHAKNMVKRGTDFARLMKALPGKTDFSGMTRSDRVAMETNRPKSELFNNPEMSKRPARGLMNHVTVTKTSPIYKAISSTLKGGSWYKDNPEDIHGIAKQLDNLDMKKVFKDNGLRMYGYGYEVWPAFACLLLMKNKEKQIEYIFKSTAALKLLIALFAGRLPLPSISRNEDKGRIKMWTKAIKHFELIRKNIKHLVPLTPGEVKIITGGALAPAARKFINMEYLGMSEAEAKKKNKA